jgi:WD40 repeat protein/serine/threonine protein kinase
MKSHDASGRSDKSLFFEAVDIPTAPARSAFLLEACAGDVRRRERLALMLEDHFRENPFMAQAAIAAHKPATSGVIDAAVGTEIGRYRILEKLGEGGFGSVFVAEQRDPVKRRVALKVIKLGMDSRQVVARFEAERQALAMMDHPNIARVFDGGVTETGRPFFVMELVKGIPITEFCEENSLGTAKRLGLFVQVCRAIEHAHQKGIIHRDIKPSNILVTSHDGIAVPKVIDFGIAKATAGELTDKTVYTQFHQLIGTPAYMSPEQAEMNGLGLDTRTDVYALGVLLYELLVGQTPFDGGELANSGLDEMRRTIREKEPMRPSTRVSAALNKRGLRQASADTLKAEDLVKALRGDLDWIVLKCLEKDRSRRFATVHELTLDIERHLHNEPVLARPPSLIYEFQKTWRRHRILLVTMTAVFGALAVGFTVSAWQTLLATRAREDALKAQRVEKSERARADANKEVAERSLYSANMSLAQLAWAQNDFARLRQILDESGRYPKRGLEWGLWQRRLHEAAKIFRGHAGEIHCVAFAPDGRHFATGSDDLTIRVWDVETGAEVLAITNQPAPVRSLAWSVDGTWILSAGGHVARVFLAATGAQRFAVTNLDARIASGAISPDGGTIAIGMADGKTRLFDTAEFHEAGPLPKLPKGVRTLAFSPDGRRLAAGSADGTTRIFELATSKEVVALAGHEDWVESVAFSPDGLRVLTASDDRTARVWDSLTGRELFALKGHSYYVRSAVFSPDGRTIATASVDWTVKLWQAKDGDEITTLKEHTGNVDAIAFSRDGSRLVSAGKDETAIVWRLDKREPGFEIGASQLMAFSTDCQRLAIADRAGTMVFDTSLGREIARPQIPAGEISAIALSGRGDRLVVGGSDRSATVWDVESGREIASLKQPDGDVVCVGFSPDGRRLVTGGRDHKLRISQTDSGRLLLEIDAAVAPIVAVEWSPDGRSIACGFSSRPEAAIWDSATGKKMGEIEGQPGGILALAFSPDGNHLATAGWDRSARVWDIATGRELANLKGHGGILRSVAFSGDGTRVITAGDDRTARVWDAESGRELFIVVHPARAVRFASDSEHIAVAGGGQATVLKAATASELATWASQEADARERVRAAKSLASKAVEAHRDELRRDPGAIRNWMILAPLKIGSIEREADLRPNDGRPWRQVDLEDYAIDFNGFLRQTTSQAVGYAFCTLFSDRERVDLRLLVGSDDQSEIFLNGQRIYATTHNRGYSPDEDMVEGVKLRAGANSLLFKVINETSEWKGSIRITDGDGLPVRGISTR